MRSFVALTLTFVTALAACAPAPAATPTIPTTDTAVSPFAPTPADPTASPLMAFVREATLYFQPLDMSTKPTVVEACPSADSCELLYPQWSPNGDYLLYLRVDYGQNAQGVLRLADRTGQTRTLAESAFFVFRPTFSPDGTRVAYFSETRQMTDMGEQLALFVALLDGAPGGAAEQVGTLNFRVGCGGGGGSPASYVYAREGYGYTGLTLAWAANDVLLYTLGCDGAGLGRFDLATRTALPGYPEDEQLRQVRLNAARTQWVAVATRNGGETGTVAVGNPAETTYTNLPIEAHVVHGAFWGAQPGQIVAVTRQSTGFDMVDASAYQDAPVFLSGGFDFYTTRLWTLDLTAHAPTLLAEYPDTFGIGTVVALAPDRLLFTQIPNDTLLRDAMQAGLPLADVMAALPRISLMQWENGQTTTLTQGGQLAVSR